jgi:CBS domain-containing protein
MATIRNLLKSKGDSVWSVPPTATVLETLKIMAEKDVGALLVLESDKILGIISERDFARAIAQSGRCMPDRMVQDYMTKEVVTAGPDRTIEECMQLMTDSKVRHLPILEGEKLVGLISIGDLVKEIITSKQSMIDILENYIEGRGYGN